MNSVIGITHLLLRTDLQEQQHRYISMIQVASEQLMAIINDILDISKIEAGKMVFEKIDFNVRQICSNVKNILSMKAAEKGLEIKLEIDKNIPEMLVGDPSRLAQILINLVGNSIKFTDQGFVEMKAAIILKSNILCEIEFSVIDTGIGIAKDKLNSIFESFTQADSDTSRKYGGAGLGLTICKQLVELQGGQIGLESKMGMGTRFYFNIAYSISGNQPDSKPVVSQETDYYANLENSRILLVEDNEFNKIVAEDTILEYLKGIKLEHASNGREALEMVTANEYDFVLMDIQMPEMDGYEATARIRKLDSDKRHTPIMAMTANATPEEIEKCYSSGVDDYISKPFQIDEFFKKMSQLKNKVPR